MPSRRALAILAASACGGHSAMIDGNIPGEATVAPKRLVAYVSGGPDIAWFTVDKANGALSKISSIAAFRAGASFLAIHGNHLYAVAEGDRVGAYTIDPASGALAFQNDVATGGDGATYVSVDATGTVAFVANYNTGSVSVFPLQNDGKLGAARQTLASGSNAHLIVADPSNKFVFVPCLGSNYVAQYLFDAGAGTLTANAVPRLATAAGAGPRHLAFAPDGVHAYLINETNSTLSALSLDTATGRLTELQTLSTRAAGATGPNTTAEVVVHPSGKFVYGSNRGDDNIAVFSVDGAGKLTPVDHTSTQGKTPRNFTLDPTGAFLYAANQASNTVVPFAIDQATGRLTPTAVPITAQTPQFVGIAAFDP
jgi:6-phosphogluconolactonase